MWIKSKSDEDVPDLGQAPVKTHTGTLADFNDIDSLKGYDWSKIHCDREKMRMI